MTTKSFKIGECAVGGIIKIDITGKVIQVKALDWYTKQVVSSGSAMSDDNNCEYKLDEYLTDLSTSYYASKILDWIKTKVKFVNLTR